MIPRNDRAAASGSGGAVSATPIAIAAASTRLAIGPASETALIAGRERSAPRWIHTAPPGSGIPPMTRNSSGRTSVSPMLA